MCVCVCVCVCEHKCTRTCECTRFTNAGQVQEYHTVILFLFQKQAIFAFVRLIACAVSMCATGACTQVQTYSVCHLLTLCYVQCNGVTCLFLTDNHQICTLQRTTRFSCHCGILHSTCTILGSLNLLHVIEQCTLLLHPTLSRSNSYAFDSGHFNQIIPKSKAHFLLKLHKHQCWKFIYTVTLQDFISAAV